MQESLISTMQINDNIIHGDADQEETLSLSDLLIYSNTSTARPGTESDELEARLYEQPFFEFFSEEWSVTSSVSANPPDNIVFCGKLIHTKGKTSENSETLDITETNPKKNRGLFKWNSDLLICQIRGSRHKITSNTTSRCTSLPSRPEKQPKNGGTRKSSTHGNNVGNLVGKATPFMSSPAKSRWFFYIFGLARFPMKMDLGDMKNRQLRKSHSRMLGLDGGVVEVARGGWSSEKGLWGMIGILSCVGRQHTNSN